MTKKNDKQRLATIMRRIEYAENWRDKTYRDKWLSYYRMWRNIVPAIKDRQGNVIADRSNISIPYPFIMLETILPRLVETLFAGRPYVAVKGVPSGVEEMQRYVQGPGGMPMPQTQQVRPWVIAAQKMETLLDYQQNVSFDIQDVFHTGLKIMCLYGTAVSYTGWRYSRRDVIRKELRPQFVEDEETGEQIPLLDDDGVTPIQDYEEITVSVKEYDDPELKFLDLGHFFVDPNASDIDDARYCGHRAYMSKAALEALKETEEGMRLDWKKIPKNPAKDESRDYRNSGIGIPTVEEAGAGFTSYEDDALYEVHHYWEDDRRVLVINRGYIAMDTANPFFHKRKPYDRDVYTEDPGQFYGIGIMEMLEDSQAELNTERNQRIDYRSMSMRRMFKVKRDASIDRRQLVWKNGGFIELEDLNDLDVLEAPDSALSGSFNSESMVKQEMKEITGAHDVVMGQSSSSETATTTMSKDNNAAMRFKLIISSVEKRLLVAISRKMIQLNQQFVDDVRLLPLFDKDEMDWPVISPEDIQGEFHLIPAGSSVEPMANKEAHKQRMVELYGVVARDPFMQQFPDKRRNLLKKVFEAFDVQDTDDILPSDEDLSGMMQQQVIQQFLSQLPPQVRQLLMTATQGGAPSDAGPPSTALTPQVGGGENSAMQQEGGLQVIGGGRGG